MAQCIYVESLFFKFSSKRVVIGSRRGGNAHLTLFFDPKTEAGQRVWTPHFTVGSRHIDLESVSEAELAAWSEGVQTALLKVFLQAHLKVDLVELEQAGWSVWQPDESLLGRLQPIFVQAGGAIKLTNGRFTKALQALSGDVERTRFAPTMLDASMFVGQPIGVLNADGASGWLVHYPTARPLGEAGWYLVKADWGALRVVMRSLSPRARVAFARVRDFLHGASV